MTDVIAHPLTSDVTVKHPLISAWPRLAVVCDAALDVNEAHSAETGNVVSHPGRQTGQPFTLLRLQLLEVVLSCARSRRAEALKCVPEPFWRALCAWFAPGPHEGAERLKHVREA